MAVEKNLPVSSKSIPREREINILAGLRFALENRIKSLLSGSEYSEDTLKAALKRVAWAAKESPTIKFHLGQNKWFDGIPLGSQQLRSKEDKQPIKMVVVFDCESKIFRFCERLETIIAPVKGFELQGQDKQGHKLFFEEGAKDQQLGLLLKTLKIIFLIRIRSLQTEA